MGEIRTFNFVNSMKGGCGKTTFSLLLSDCLSSVRLANGELKSGDKKDSEKCLILDMDLQGTAMQYLFKGNSEDSKKVDDKKIEYLNDAVRNGEKPDKYITENELENGDVINVIFSNPKIQEKEKYRVSAQGSYSPVVRHNVFRDGLKEFLKKFEGLPQRHFIFDMPPNSDGFSDAAMECLLNKHHSVAKENDKINLFYLLGLDGSHIKPTIDEIENLLKRKDIIEFTNIFIIFNENIPLSFGNIPLSIDNINDPENEEEKEIDLKTECKIKKDAITKRLTNLKYNEKNKIHFAVVSRNVKYANWCVRGEGLCSWKSSNNLFVGIPISMYAEFTDKDFTEIKIDENCKDIIKDKNFIDKFICPLLECKPKENKKHKKNDEMKEGEAIG